MLKDNDKKQQEQEESKEASSLHKVNAIALGVKSESLAKVISQESPELASGNAIANAQNRPGNEHVMSDAGDLGFELFMPILDIVHPGGLSPMISEPVDAMVADGKDIQASQRELNQQKDQSIQLTAVPPAERIKREERLLKVCADESEKLSIRKLCPSIGRSSTKEEEEQNGVNHLHR